MSVKRKASQSQEPTAKRQNSGDDDYAQDNRPKQPVFVNEPTMASDAEIGIIQQIKLINFMCHDYLEMDFGPQINFIVGRNGSGKSSILTALVVGLGGEASATSHGSEVNRLIKFQRQMAEVTVKLRNRGPGAFKPTEYGDSITVQSQFHFDGSILYKIFSNDGHVVSDTREEITRILDQFNIQVENPAALLNQEISQNLLHNLNPSQKYEMFFKATQFDQMIKFRFAQEQIDDTWDLITDKENMLTGLEREFKEWQQKFFSTCSKDDLKVNMSALRNELAWALVHTKEKDVELLMRELCIHKTQMLQFEQKCLNIQEKVDVSKKSNKEIHDRLNELTDHAKILQLNNEQIKKELIDAKKVHRTSELDFKRVESDMCACYKGKKQLLEKIATLRKLKLNDYKHINRIEELEVVLRQNNGQIISAEQYMEQLQSSLNQQKEELYRIKCDEQEQKAVVNEISQKISELEKTRTNKLRRYGKLCPDLLQKIEEAYQRGRFHQKPIGPLGELIHPRENRWALAIECCLGGLLKAFCCNSIEDSKVLQELIQELRIPEYQSPRIIISPSLKAIHDVINHNDLATKYPTILDMLDIDDPVVANCLIDQRGIENVFLIDEAEVVMDKHLPSNIKEVFLSCGDQIYTKPTCRYYPANISQVHLLKEKVDELKVAQDKFLIAEHHLKGVQQMKMTLKAISRWKQAEVRNTDDRIMNMREVKNNLTNKISELKNREVPTPGDVVTLEEEVLKYNKQIDDLEQQMQVKKEVINDAKDKLDQATETAMKTDAEIKSVADMSDQVRVELAQCDDSVDTAEHEKRHYDSKKKEQEKKIKDISTKVEKEKENLATVVKMAELICPQITTRRTVQNLESEINQIQKHIQSEEKNHGNKEEIMQKYNEKKKAYVKIRKEVKQLHDFVKNLKVVMNHRQQQNKEFRRLLAIRARYFFIMMLTIRNYKGHMTFNHDKQHLTLSVQSTVTNGDHPSDIRSMSVGERSLAGLFFLMALWDANDSPFRCLDEFAVHLDMVNRKICTDMVMTAAREQRDRQFIFITSQDTSDLDLGDDVYIHRMSECGQGQIVEDEN